MKCGAGGEVRTIEMRGRRRENNINEEENEASILYEELASRGGVSNKNCVSFKKELVYLRPH